MLLVFSPVAWYKNATIQDIVFIFFVTRTSSAKITVVRLSMAKPLDPNSMQIDQL